MALVAASGQCTYGELRSAASTLAAEIAALELPPGSRVGMLGPNSLFWVAAYLAVMKLGHVAVPFSDKLTADDIRRNATWSGARVMFADRSVAAQVLRGVRWRLRGYHRGEPSGQAGNPAGPTRSRSTRVPTPP